MGVENNRILVVEDEKPIRDAVSAYLENEGYWVTTAADGALALEEFAKHKFALVALDLMLPKVSGERVCRTIREESDVPIIMLTAKGEVEDRVLGLELGADDYLVKPFSPRELVARVRALMRRANNDSRSAKESLEFGPLVIDLIARRLYLDGKFIETITTSEFNLLVTMARQPGRVFSRMELVEKVLGYDYEGYERTIDSHVKNLRFKLGDNSRMDKWIQTVHGVGYRFETPDSVANAKSTMQTKSSLDADLEARLAEAEKNSLLNSGRAMTRARKEEARKEAAYRAAIKRSEELAAAQYMKGMKGEGEGSASADHTDGASEGNGESAAKDLGSLINASDGADAHPPSANLGASDAADVCGTTSCKAS